GGGRRVPGRDRRRGSAGAPRRAVSPGPRRGRGPGADRGAAGQGSIGADRGRTRRAVAAAGPRVLRRAQRRRVARVEGLRGGHEPGARPRAARPSPFRARQSRVKPSFYARPVLEVAPDLVGCVVSHAGTSGVIVETEAYHDSEPASHAFVGLTQRNAILFGPPGRAYVYRSYGI